MDLGLQGKSVVITGASRGIGKAIALGFAAEGANLSICARGTEALDAAAAEIAEKGVKVHAQVCDVANGDAVVSFLEASRSALGSVDVLVNNASGFSAADTEEDWARGLSIDVMTSVRATWTVAPWMEAAGGGSIIHIASIAAVEAGNPPAYSAAKAAMVSHAKNVAVQLAPKGIRVNTIAPGSIDFPGGIWQQIKEAAPAVYDQTRATIPWGRFGTPAEVADVVVFIASERAGWVSGACVPVDAGQHRGNL